MLVGFEGVGDGRKRPENGRPDQPAKLKLDCSGCFSAVSPGKGGLLWRPFAVEVRQSYDIRTNKLSVLSTGMGLDKGDIGMCSHSHAIKPSVPHIHRSTRLAHA